LHTVRLPDELVDRVDAFASSNGLSWSAGLRTLVYESLDRYETASRVNFNEETLTA
jgi:hypothetical protein